MKDEFGNLSDTFNTIFSLLPILFVILVVYWLSIKSSAGRKKRVANKDVDINAISTGNIESSPPSSFSEKVAEARAAAEDRDQEKKRREELFVENTERNILKALNDEEKIVELLKLSGPNPDENWKNTLLWRGPGIDVIENLFKTSEPINNRVQILKKEGIMLGKHIIPESTWRSGGEQGVSLAIWCIYLK